MADPLGGKEPVAEVGLRRRARADRRARRGEEIELRAVGVRRVDDRRALAEAACAREQLDRAAPVLGEALLDLLRLLVRVNMERERMLGGYRPISSSQSRGQARTEWGASPTRDAPGAKLLDLGEVRGRPTPGGSGRGHRGHTRRAAARRRLPPRRPPRLRRTPRRARGSGTRRLPCSRPTASRGRSARTRCARAPASGAPPRRALSPATPRSRRLPPAPEAHAGTCGCER